MPFPMLIVCTSLPRHIAWLTNVVATMAFWRNHQFWIFLLLCSTNRERIQCNSWYVFMSCDFSVNYFSFLYQNTEMKCRRNWPYEFASRLDTNWIHCKFCTSNTTKFWKTSSYSQPMSLNSLEKVGNFNFNLKATWSNKIIFEFEEKRIQDPMWCENYYARNNAKKFCATTVVEVSDHDTEKNEFRSYFKFVPILLKANENS